MHVGEIDVAEGDSAGGDLVAGPMALRVLGDRASECLGADHRRVVGAGNGDDDVLRDDAAVLVIEGDGIGLVHRLAGGELIERGVACRVGPGDQPARTSKTGRMNLIVMRFESSTLSLVALVTMTLSMGISRKPFM